MTFFFQLHQGNRSAKKSKPTPETVKILAAAVRGGTHA
jgi:hypothetical protein